MMTFDKRGKHKITARNYEYARKLFMSIPRSEETNRKISESRMGIIPWNKGEGDCK